MIKINCPVQTYAWGKVGESSLVARLKRLSGDESFSMGASMTYAELWMGTHPSGPSTVSTSGELLSHWLESQPNIVGQVPDSYPTNDLPFLFKVLSINTALSIQAHPDKELAKLLHQQSPSIYKDPNHKPEMVLALTPFECLCGFRSIPEILANIVLFPEFDRLLKLAGFDASTFDKSDETAFVKAMFEHYVRVAEVDSALLQEELTNRLKGKDTTSNLESLIIRLSQQYPSDNGIFAPLVLNYLEMKCGDSFFIEANEPHAYISGDCIECMALSDNVVRAGLTPKLKDVNVLCNMLTYKTGPPCFLTPTQVDANTQLYRPPKSSCAEFELEKIEISQHSTADIISLPCASILLFLNGTGTTKTIENNTNQEFHSGEVYFLGAGERLAIENQQVDNLVVFRAHINLD